MSYCRKTEKSHASKTKSSGEARPFASLFAKANLTSSNTKKQGQTKEESKKKDSKHVISKIDLVSTSKKSDVKLDTPKTSSVIKKETSKKGVAKTEPDKNGMTSMCSQYCCIYGHTIETLNCRRCHSICDV